MSNNTMITAINTTTTLNLCIVPSFLQQTLSKKKNRERLLLPHLIPLVTEACPGTAYRLRSVPGNLAHCYRDPRPLHPQVQVQAGDSSPDWVPRHRVRFEWLAISSVTAHYSPPCD